MIDPRTPTIVFVCWSCGEDLKAEAKNRDIVCPKCAAVYECEASVVMTKPAVKGKE